MYLVGLSERLYFVHIGSSGSSVERMCAVFVGNVDFTVEDFWLNILSFKSSLASID